MTTNSTEDRKPCPICLSAPVYERTLNNIDLVRCAGCGFVYADIDDDAIEAANFHFDNETVEKYCGLQTWVDWFWFARIARRITHKVVAGTVLDVGCGNGLLLRQFLELGWIGVGLDPSPWAKSCAQGYEVVQSTLGQAPFPNDHFEAVTNTAVLEHVARPGSYVEEVMRILKPGGCAYFNVPNYGSLAIRLGISDFPSNIPPWHANYFTHKTLRRLFMPVEHTIENITVRSYGIPQSYGAYVWIHRKLRSRIAEAKPQEQPQTNRYRKDYQRVLSRLLGSIYYHTGRPLKMGDKLEIMVIKRTI
jgi:SAM-dependent methyltransferase